MLSNIHRQGIAVPGDQALGRLLGKLAFIAGGKTRISCVALTGIAASRLEMSTSRLSIAEISDRTRPDLCGINMKSSSASPDLLG